MRGLSDKKKAKEVVKGKFIKTFVDIIYAAALGNKI